MTDPQSYEPPPRNPLIGITILGGAMFMMFGMVSSDTCLNVGAILFSGGLISYTIQESQHERNR